MDWGLRRAIKPWASLSTAHDAILLDIHTKLVPDKSLTIELVHHADGKPVWSTELPLKLFWPKTKSEFPTINLPRGGRL